MELFSCSIKFALYRSTVVTKARFSVFVTLCFPRFKFRSIYGGIGSISISVSKVSHLLINSTYFFIIVIFKVYFKDP